MIQDFIEQQKKYYACASCGYSPANRAEWCDVRCGRDYNRMVDITRAYTLAYQEGRRAAWKELGADYLDVNDGVDVEEEAEKMGCEECAANFGRGFGKFRDDLTIRAKAIGLTE